MAKRGACGNRVCQDRRQGTGRGAIAVAAVLKDTRSSAVDVVLHVHAAAASCECSNLSLACSSKLVPLFLSSLLL